MWLQQPMHLNLSSFAWNSSQTTSLSGLIRFKSVLNTFQRAFTRLDSYRIRENTLSDQALSFGTPLQMVSPSRRAKPPFGIRPKCIAYIFSYIKKINVIYKKKKKIWFILHLTLPYSYMQQIVTLLHELKGLISLVFGTTHDIQFLTVQKKCY